MNADSDQHNDRELYLLLAKVSIPIIIIVAAYIFLPRPSQLENRDHDISNQRVVIIPTPGIPPRFKQVLEADLEKAHNFDFLVTTEMGIDEMWRLETNQINCHSLAAHGSKVFRSLNRPNSYCIILTNEDINTPQSGLRFNFAAYYEGMAVVSLARLNPRNHGVTFSFVSIPMMFQATRERALKLINRAIGRGYYGHPLSSNRSSVMYSPIMSIEDLDSIGTWYTENKSEQAH